MLYYQVDYNKIAYSEYFKSFIKCVDYYDNDNWYFVLCNRRGHKKLFNKIVHKANTSYNNFTWIEPWR